MLNHEVLISEPHPSSPGADAFRVWLIVLALNFDSRRNRHLGVCPEVLRLSERAQGQFVRQTWRRGWPVHNSSLLYADKNR